MPGWTIVADLALSTCLDINKNLIIGLLSAVSYCLVGYTKDILVVAAAAIAGTETVGATQWEAYAVLILGQTVWTLKKICARLDGPVDETAPLKAVPVHPLEEKLLPLRHDPGGPEPPEDKSGSGANDDSIWSYAGDEHDDPEVGPLSQSRGPSTGRLHL